MASLVTLADLWPPALIHPQFEFHVGEAAALGAVLAMILAMAIYHHLWRGNLGHRRAPAAQPSSDVLFLLPNHFQIMGRVAATRHMSHRVQKECRLSSLLWTVASTSLPPLGCER